MIINYTLLFTAALLCLPVIFLLLQVLAAIFLPKQSFKLQIHVEIPTLAILIPAHNESVGITKTIQSILPQLRTADVLLVVADNCIDDTAIIAKSLGATVIERTNATLRGKSYALDFGFKYLSKQSPQVVIVIDADCVISENFITTISQACIQSQRPIQALDLMLSPSQASLKIKIAEFAWAVKNKVRPLGSKVLGLPCQLMGTGMAFLWIDIAQMNLDSGHIAEDMKLGIDFCRINKSPKFLPDVMVTSYFMQDEQASKTQRARWEHGHLSMIISEAPRLIVEALKLRNMQMIGLALDLIVPPLAVLVLLCIVLFLLSLIAHAKQAIMLTGFLLALLTLAVLLAWVFFGRSIISFKQLCYAPIYAFKKIPIYIKFFINRQVDWVRAKRD